jgi:hypothetical protein
MPAPLGSAPGDHFSAATAMTDPPFAMGGLQTVAATTMMQPANGMPQLADTLFYGGADRCLFPDARCELISLESALVARMPQLDDMIQSFNAMVTGVDSAIPSHGPLSREFYETGACCFAANANVASRKVGRAATRRCVCGD